MWPDNMVLLTWTEHGNIVLVASELLAARAAL
jgi:hypothetical protein